MAVEDTVKEVFQTVLDVKPEEIKPEDKLEDSLGVDSTEMVEIVIVLEKTFNTKLSTKEITKFSTINEIEKLIQSKINS